MCQSQIFVAHNPESDTEGPGCSLVRRLGPESCFGLRLLPLELHTCGSVKVYALTLLAPSVDLADGNAVATK